MQRSQTAIADGRRTSCAKWRLTLDAGTLAKAGTRDEKDGRSNRHRDRFRGNGADEENQGFQHAAIGHPP